MIDSYLSSLFSAGTRRKIYHFAGLLALVGGSVIQGYTVWTANGGHGYEWWPQVSALIAWATAGLSFLAKANVDSMPETEDGAQDDLSEDTDVVSQDSEAVASK